MSIQSSENKGIGSPAVVKTANERFIYTLGRVDGLKGGTMDDRRIYSEQRVVSGIGQCGGVISRDLYAKV